MRQTPILATGILAALLLGGCIGSGAAVEPPDVSKDSENAGLDGMEVPVVDPAEGTLRKGIVGACVPQDSGSRCVGSNSGYTEGLEVRGPVTGESTFEWTPSSPFTQRMRVVLNGPDGNVFGVTGTSPLVIPFEALASGNYELFAYFPDVTAGAVDQELAFRFKLAG